MRIYIENWPSARLALGMAITLVISLCCAHAQTYHPIHYFTGGQDGGNPTGALAIDNSGNLYGTAQVGGNLALCSNIGNVAGCGTVFEIMASGSGWIFKPLYQFQGGGDGSYSWAGIVIGAGGVLYGTTYGRANNNGTVYLLLPASATPCETIFCFWRETVIHSFQGYPNDGSGPGYGDLLSDQAGNFYGTTAYAGSINSGAVYELVRSGDSWTESILYNFTGPNDGAYPFGGLIFDAAGNLYGTTLEGGSGGAGTVFELTPSNGSESVLYAFRNGDGVGYGPTSTLVMDQAGNLYATTSRGPGAAFELTPSNGQWSVSKYYTAPYFGSYAGLTMDTAGNFYGVSYVGSNCGISSGDGFVFKLTNSNGSWTCTDFHDFGGGDGAYPVGSVTLDAAGNIYGTTAAGGQGNCTYNSVGGCGIVWKITTAPSQLAASLRK